MVIFGVTCNVAHTFLGETDRAETARIHVRPVGARPEDMDLIYARCYCRYKTYSELECTRNKKGMCHANGIQNSQEDARHCLVLVASPASSSSGRSDKSNDETSTVISIPKRSPAPKLPSSLGRPSAPPPARLLKRPPILAKVRL